MSRFGPLVLAIAALGFAGSVLAQDFSRLQPDILTMERAKGFAVKGEYERAHESYKSAAEYGNKEAQKLVGLQYLEGQGVDADAAMAHAWLRLASSFGNKRIETSFKELDTTLPDEARAQAEKNFAQINKEYGDKKALKKRKSWARRELKSNAGRGRPNPMEQTQIQIEGTYYRISLGQLMDSLDDYVDDFEAKIKG